MPAFFPIQTSFARGEQSPRMRGRVDTKEYREGLAKCENWIPTPQGSLLRRNGSQVVAVTSEKVLRLFPFKSLNLEQYVVALQDQKLRVFTPTGVFAAFAPELIVNGGCEPGLGGWVFTGEGSGYYGPPGARWFYGHGAGYNAGQTVLALPAGAYKLTFEVGSDVFPNKKVRVTSSVSGVLLEAYTTGSGKWNSMEFTFAVPVLANITIQFGSDVEGWGAVVRNVSMRSLATADFIAAPWKVGETDSVQVACEPGRDRMVFVQQGYEPRVLTRAANGVWSLDLISTVGWTIPVDSGWAGSNWPSVVEVWQGRLWLAATPAKKNTFWASKPGSYDFTLGNTASDAFSYDVAAKGVFRWMQGQKVMLVGTDDGEYSISANDGVVYAGNIDIRQESAYGSAPVQACAIGDEVLYVSADRRKLRTIRFSLEGGGWYSRDLTFGAEHITKAGIADLAFARDPFNAVMMLLQDGTFAGCNYDRAEQVNGGWRFLHDLAAGCATVLATPEGAELWFAAGLGLYRAPFCETEVMQLDRLESGQAPTSSVAGTMAYTAATKSLASSAGVLTQYAVGRRLRVGPVVLRVTAALDNIPYTPATVEVVDGSDEDVAATADFAWLDGYFPIKAAAEGEELTVRATVVATGEVLDFDAVVKAATVNGATGRYIIIPDMNNLASAVQAGVGFMARAETLPLEGGNPGGTSQGFKVHYPDIAVRVADSMPPLVNGKRVGAGRPFSTPLDTMPVRVTADLALKNVGVSEGGVITIEQDLPFRTEVCAIYAQAQVNKV